MKPIQQPLRNRSHICTSKACYPRTPVLVVKTVCLVDLEVMSEVFQSANVGYLVGNWRATPSAVCAYLYIVRGLGNCPGSGACIIKVCFVSEAQLRELPPADR